MKKEEVHPRPRGEYLGIVSICFSLAGSPPPTRGILLEQLMVMIFLRFTPAHAGNTY